MFQVRIHGRGGQGVVTAAEMLSIAAFLEGKHAQAFPNFGSERTGAPVVAFCRIDSKEIRLREPIMAPDAIIIQDPTLLHQVDVFQGLKADGYVLINSRKSFEDLGIAEVAHELRDDRQVCVPATEIALQHLGRPLPNAVLLGAFAALSRIIALDSVAAAIRDKFSGKVAEGNIAAAVAEAEVLFVVVPAFAHTSIFSRMIPHLRDGQAVVIIPGNYGGMMLSKMMRDHGLKQAIIIAETPSLPYACRIKSHNTVQIHKRKNTLKVASLPARHTSEVLDLMNDLFSGYIAYTPAGNVLEVTLDNVNFPLHPLPILLNYGAIEMNPATFRHYLDGITPLISEQMTAMDNERLAVGKAYGLNLIPLLEQLKIYYGMNEAKTIYEYVNSDESPYKDIIGHSVRSRYLSEDVPYLIAPSVALAKKVGVETPVVKLVVDLASTLHGTDYWTVGG